MALLDLTSCSQRVARPSLRPRQQQVRASLDHGPYGLFGEQCMGPTQSRRKVSEGRWKQAKEEVEPKKVGCLTEVAIR